MISLVAHPETHTPTRPGLQARVVRATGVDRSVVSKIANGTYQPSTPRGLMVVAKVRMALAREARLLEHAAQEAQRGKVAVTLYQREKAKRDSRERKRLGALGKKLAAFEAEAATKQPVRRRPA